MPRKPETVGKYKIISEIAKGGMGAVYKAEHPTLNRFVIIKKLTLRGDASVRERFRREARIMMDFKNDYIVDVYDHFREGSSYYIVLEYVDGVSLEQLLRRERYLPEEIALLVFRDCCRALAYAHGRGVVHRDIKPANILISHDGHVKLVDFGIASLHEEVESGLTRDGMTLGTPSYMAPEQFENTRGVDRRADVYSMGVMLYEMLTGKKPFPGTMTAEAIRLIQQGKYVKPHKINPKISRFSRRLIRTCMRVKPRRRFQELGQVLRLLERSLGGKRRAPAPQRISAFLGGSWTPLKRRSLIARAAPAAAAALLAAAVATSYVGYRHGYHYELFQADEYGAFTLRLRVQKEDTRLETMQPRALLFVDDGGDVPEVTDVSLLFTEVPELETADYRVFETARMYQPAGAYRIKLAAADRLFWHSFRLAPRAVQRETAATADTLMLDFAVPAPRPEPLQVELQVRDAVSGERIADPHVWVQQRGRWVPFVGPRVDELQTGQVHTFRIRSELHYPSDYALRIDAHQRDLLLAARLNPIPGAVRVMAAEPGVELRLDGKSVYLQAGRRPRYAETGRTGEDPVELLLAPGRYRLSAHGSGRSEAIITVDVDPYRRTVVYLESEADGLAFRLGEQRMDRSLAD